jgi:dienelactone hydrolase
LVLLRNATHLGDLLHNRSPPRWEAGRHNVYAAGKSVSYFLSICSLLQALTYYSPVEMYCAAPHNGPNGKGVLILSDLMGHKSINIQLVADNFAVNGYMAIVPDLFKGDAVVERPPNFDILNWLKEHLPDQIDPIVETTIGALKQYGKCTKIAGVGYCLGAKYVLRFLKPNYRKKSKRTPLPTCPPKGTRPLLDSTC